MTIDKCTFFPGASRATRIRVHVHAREECHERS